MKDIYKDILYIYQKEAFDKSMSFDKFFLGLDVGAGKTLTSLAITQKKNFENIVIVAQASKLDDWADDVEKFLGLETHILRGGKAKDDKTLDTFTGGAIIASYQTIWRRDKVMSLLDDSFMIIIDESQYLKTRTSKISKWGLKATQLSKGVLLLSGTPLNKPEDLFTQLKMLGMSMKYKEFSEKFFITEEVKYPGARWPVKVIVGYKNEESLFEAFRKQGYFIKSKDAIDLPQQVFTDIKLTHDKKKIYDYVKKNGTYEDLIIESPGVKYLRLRQLSSGYIEDYKGLSNHKKTALKDLLESNPNNFTVFYSFVQELEDIKSVCKELGIKVFEFNGAVKNGYDSRDYDGRFIVALQYQSGAEGLNLQHIHNQLYYSPPQSFIKYKQSLARIHRIGQENKCFYYRFKTKGTVENKIYNSLELGKDYDEMAFIEDEEKIGYTIH